MRIIGRSTKLNIVRTILWILVAIWMALIFSFSAQNAESSSSLSGGTIEVILKTVIRDFGSIPSERQADMIESYQLVARKSAHFLAYLVLGILSTAALLQYPLKSKMRFRTAMLICSGYAVTDEIHQLFVPGRSCRITDVFIDSFGAAIGILLAMLIYRLYRTSRGKSK